MVPAVKALNPQRLVETHRRVESAIAPDNTVNRDAVNPALPWQRAAFQVWGTAVVGTSLGGILPMPQGATIRHIAIYARVAPSSGPFTATITGGVRNETVSIPVGQSSNTVGANIPVASGAALRLDVLQGGGAQDVTLTIHYVPGGA